MSSHSPSVNTPASSWAEKKTKKAIPPIKSITVMCDASSFLHYPYLGEQLVEFFKSLRKRNIKTSYVEDRMELLEKTGEYFPPEFWREKEEEKNKISAEHRHSYRKFIDSIQPFCKIYHQNSALFSHVTLRDFDIVQEFIFADERFRRWPMIKENIRKRVYDRHAIHPYYQALHYAALQFTYMLDRVHALPKDVLEKIPEEDRQMLGLDQYPPRENGKGYSWLDIEFNPDNIPPYLIKMLTTTPYMLNLLGKQGTLTEIGKSRMDRQKDYGESAIVQTVLEICNRIKRISKTRTKSQAREDMNPLLIVIEDRNAIRQLESLRESHSNIWVLLPWNLLKQ